ncbi:MAG: hypothetical protein AAF318_05040 [Pseudomonadota bacterium]
MNTERRILTPIAATVAGALLVGVATLGGTLAGDDVVTPKADRFAVIGDELCAGQDWPNLTPECLAWSEGESIGGQVRFITVNDTDASARTTTLTRVREIVTN